MNSIKSFVSLLLAPFQGTGKKRKRQDNIDPIDTSSPSQEASGSADPPVAERRFVKSQRRAGKNAKQPASSTPPGVHEDTYANFIAENKSNPPADNDRSAKRARFDVPDVPPRRGAAFSFTTAPPPPPPPRPPLLVWRALVARPKDEPRRVRRTSRRTSGLGWESYGRRSPCLSSSRRPTPRFLS